MILSSTLLRRPRAQRAPRRSLRVTEKATEPVNPVVKPTEPIAVKSTEPEEQTTYGEVIDALNKAIQAANEKLKTDISVNEIVSLQKTIKKYTNWIEKNKMHQRDEVL